MARRLTSNPFSSMSVALPASLWRRLIAAVYDGLLLIGLWFATSLVEIVVRGQLLGLPRHLLWLQMLMLGVGAIFFCLSWTRGGQTPGMRAWHLQVQRGDGEPLRVPIALTRYFTLLMTWAAATAPLLLLIPTIAERTEIRNVILAGAGFAVLSAIAMITGGLRRAPCDWVAGTVVMQLPNNSRA